MIGDVDGHIEEKNGNKYLTFASTEKNNKQIFGIKLNIIFRQKIQANLVNMKKITWKSNSIQMMIYH